LVSYDAEQDLLVVERQTGGSCIVIDLANDQIRITSGGDISLEAGGVLRLAGKEGIEMKSPEETIIQGKMVRIN